MRARHGFALTTTMAVPKTPVNENDFSPPGEHEVGHAWQTPVVQPEPIAHSVDQTTNGKLGRSVLSTDSAH